MKSMMGLAVLLTALGGCSNPTKHQSTGFSGVGSEPAVTQTSIGDPRLVSGALYADIPYRSVRSGSSNRADHAQLAIRKASGGGWRSKPVNVGSQTLALSVLYVNSIPYAVLKPKAGLFSAHIVPETSAAFAAQARSLTGCPAASSVYAYGPQPNRPQGLTLALACSG